MKPQMSQTEILNPQSLRVYEADFADKTPILLMLVGIPGSGKSTLAKQVKDTWEFASSIEILSSDALRQELYGDVNHQADNTELFLKLHRRIKDLLRNGISVVYDATNINKKRRIAFLKELKSINCKAICCAVMTPYETCVRFNKERNRSVPTEVVRKMWLNWQPPHISEGFDEVIFHSSVADDVSSIYPTIQSLFDPQNGIMNYDQNNMHHQYTLGMHCLHTMLYTMQHRPDNTDLHIAALLHDIGKLYTQSYVNMNGQYDGNCHYYNHHCVSAYESVLYMMHMKNMTNKRMSYIANLIFYHMHPYLSWKHSLSAKTRDSKLLGEDMFADIMQLHAADLSAH